MKNFQQKTIEKPNFDFNNFVIHGRQFFKK